MLLQCSSMTAPVWYLQMSFRSASHRVSCWHWTTGSQSLSQSSCQGPSAPQMSRQASTIAVCSSHSLSPYPRRKTACSVLLFAAMSLYLYLTQSSSPPRVFVTTVAATTAATANFGFAY